MRLSLPGLLAHAAVLEDERAFAAVDFARRGASAERDPGADADASAATAEDPERRKERRAARRADALGKPGIDVAAVGHLGAAHRSAPLRDHFVVARAVPGRSRGADVAARRRRRATGQ